MGSFQLRDRHVRGHCDRAHGHTRSAGPEDGGTRQGRRLEGIMPESPSTQVWFMCGICLPGGNVKEQDLRGPFACRYPPFIKLYMAVLQNMYVTSKNKVQFGVFHRHLLNDRCWHGATALNIYGTENVRHVEKHYAMFTES